MTLVEIDKQQTGFRVLLKVTQRIEVIVSLVVGNCEFVFVVYSHKARITTAV